MMLWLKVKVWGIAFIVMFGIHSCHMDQVKQEEARQQFEKEQYMRRVMEQMDRNYEQRQKEDSIRKNMKYTIVKTHSDDSDDDNDDGYFDGLDDAELDRETGAEFGTSYDDSGGENDDYDEGYDDGYEDEW